MPLLLFLVFDRNYGWGLLLPRQNLLWENSPVAMLRNDETLFFELDRARTPTLDFFLFGMPNNVRGLGEPDYPAVEAPPTATRFDSTGDALHVH